MMPDRLHVTEERIKGIITGWVRDRDSELHFFKGGPSLWYLIYPEKDNDDDFNVNFKLRLHNESNEALHLDQIQVVSGFVKKAIVHQMPGTKGYMNGRKLWATAGGCVGTMAWTIGNTGKLFVVMYSIPYDQNWYSNWLGAGIFDKDPEYSMDNPFDFFNKMYYGDEYHFARKDFYYDQLPLTYSRDEFAIKGIMDTTHQCNIEITFCSADSE